MSSFFEVFPSGRAFLPVIHVETEEQTGRNVAVAFNNGADGVFLIAHGHEANAQWLCTIYNKVRSQFPQQFIGLNFLDLFPLQAVQTVPKNASALWLDDIGIRDNTSSTDRIAALARAHNHICPDLLMFGGIAFKYQTLVTDPARAAQISIPYIDVITTSGEQTGAPPTVEKIQVMRDAVGTHPIAIASGMTPQNVVLFAPYANAFLVATGISVPGSFTELDPQLVKAFAQALQAFRTK